MAGTKTLIEIIDMLRLAGRGAEGIDAWHGTPHLFQPETIVRDKMGNVAFKSGLPSNPEFRADDISEILKELPYGRFRSDKMGTGEGAQAFGAGSYQAQAEPTAREYMERLASRSGIRSFEDPSIPQLPSWVARGLEMGTPPTDMKAEFSNRLDEIIAKLNDPDTMQPWMLTPQKTTVEDTLKAIDAYVAGAKLAQPGYMLKTKIYADPDKLLNWDTPLAEQPHVLSAIDDRFGDPEIVLPRMSLDPEKARGGDLYSTISRGMSSSGRPAASQTLSEMGIPGTKYLDQLSRNNLEGGTSNYVIFDPRMIEITDRFANGGRIAKGFGGKLTGEALEALMRLARQEVGNSNVASTGMKVIEGGIDDPLTLTAAARAAENAQAIETAKRLGYDPSNVNQVREAQSLQDFHTRFMADMSERAKEKGNLIRQYIEEGKFPMEVGTRYQTSKSIEQGGLPYEITGYYIDSKNPAGRYGYHVRRGDEESGMHLIRDPKLEALHGPEKWEQLQADRIPMFGPRVVKASGGMVYDDADIDAAMMIAQRDHKAGGGGMATARTYEEPANIGMYGELPELPYDQDKSFNTGEQVRSLYDAYTPQLVKPYVDAMATVAGNPAAFSPMGQAITEARGTAPEVTPYTGGDLGGTFMDFSAGPMINVGVNTATGQPSQTADYIDAALNLGGGALLAKGLPYVKPALDAGYRGIKAMLPAAAGTAALTAGSEDAEAAGAGLFSKAMKVIRDLPMNKMEGPQALAMLGKAGVGADELKWTGLTDALASQGTVTKDDIMNLVRQNDVQLGETILRNKTNYPYQGDEWPRAINAAELRDDWDEVNRLTAAWEASEGVGGYNNPKFQKYSLPGGGKYQETLITMPPKKFDKNSPEMRAEAEKIYAAKDIDGLSDAQWEIVAKNLQNSPKFVSQHWDDPNVLAHIRTQEFPIPNPEGGKPLRAFNLDELQSDWAQEGRKKGFKDPVADAKRKEIQREMDRLVNERQELESKIRLQYDKDIEPYNAAYQSEIELAEKDFSNSKQGKFDIEDLNKASDIAHEKTKHLFDPIADKMQADLRAVRQQYSQQYQPLLEQKQKLPQMGFMDPGPYIQSTNQWTDLGLKKGLSQALDRNADMFTWTPGEVQASRYDLSKEVNRIYVLPDDNGKYHVGTELLNGQEYAAASGLMDLDRIEKTFGKEIAKKVKDGEFTGTQDNTSYIAGDDLKVGGKGMIDFYNNIIPKRLTEVIRKATGQKPQFETFTVQTRNGPQQVQGIRLTPEMKAKLQAIKETEGGYFPHMAYGGKVDDSSVNKALQIAAEASI
jgi:hypothetical protein